MVYLIYNFLINYIEHSSYSICGQILLVLVDKDMIKYYHNDII